MMVGVRDRGQEMGVPVGKVRFCLDFIPSQLETFQDFKQV